MTKASYLRLLKSTYNYLGRHEMSASSAEALDKIFALAHPEREVAFVAWPLGVPRNAKVARVKPRIIN